jgi:hypothetical protein
MRLELGLHLSDEAALLAHMDAHSATAVPVFGTLTYAAPLPPRALTDCERCTEALTPCIDARAAEAHAVLDAYLPALWEVSWAHGDG